MNTTQVLCNPFLKLPQEIFTLIVKQVPAEVLAKTARVSKAWLAGLRNYEVHKHITLGLRAKWKNDLFAQLDGPHRYKVEHVNTDLPLHEQKGILDNFYLVPLADQVIVKAISGAQRVFSLPVTQDKILGCWESAYLIIKTKQGIQISSKTGAVLKTVYFPKECEYHLKHGFIVLSFVDKTRLYSLNEGRFVTDYLPTSGKIIGIFQGDDCIVSLEAKRLTCFNFNGEVIASLSLVPLPDDYHKEGALKDCYLFQKSMGLYFQITDEKMQIVTAWFIDKSLVLWHDIQSVYSLAIFGNLLLRLDSRSWVSVNGNGLGRSLLIDWIEQPADYEYQWRRSFCNPILNEGRIQFHVTYKKGSNQFENHVCQFVLY